MERILLVDDDAAVRKALRYLFESEGYTIALAADGLAGLKAYRAVNPALVILDLKLPGLAGREVCNQIRREDAATPIIILSGCTDEADKLLLFELGADDFVTKPFSPRELLARARAAMRRCRGGSRIPGKADIDGSARSC